MSTSVLEVRNQLKWIKMRTIRGIKLMKCGEIFLIKKEINQLNKWIRRWKSMRKNSKLGGLNTISRSLKRENQRRKMTLIMKLNQKSQKEIGRRRKKKRKLARVKRSKSKKQRKTKMKRKRKTKKGKVRTKNDFLTQNTDSFDSNGQQLTIIMNKNMLTFTILGIQLIFLLQQNSMKKILLMGSEGTGKTSMHSVLFAKCSAKDTYKIGPSIEKKQHKQRFMGNLILNLWDCPGQDTFMKNYFMSEKQSMFERVQVLIFVLGIDQSQQQFFKSLEYLKLAVQNMEQSNPQGLFFILLHKIDQIPKEERQQVLSKKILLINQNVPSQKIKTAQFFATSIWDESLYQAWSHIVQAVIPNRIKINQTLKKISQFSECEEIALFEKQTYLIVGSYNQNGNKDLTKYEKLANLIKQFKLVCKKNASNIRDITIETDSFCCLIAEFTETQKILLLFKNRQTKTAAQWNLRNMGKVFQLEKNKFEKVNLSC